MEANEESSTGDAKKAASMMNMYEKFGLLLNSSSKSPSNQSAIFHRKEAAIPDFYRQHLFSELNIRLNSSLDLNSARNHSYESRRIYSDFSKNNLTAPVDVSGVRSVLKDYMKPSGYKSSTNLSVRIKNDKDEDDDDSSSCESLNEPLKTRPVKLETDRGLRVKKPPPVNKSLSNVRVIKSSDHNQHKGSIYNYRKSVRNNAFCFKITKTEDNDIAEDKRPEVVQHVFYSDGIYSNKEKYQKRVQEARDKVLSGQVEKSKLNKMTVIHPFEDTKILINTDKVPNEIMHKILGTSSDSIRPMYYIPPVRPFGYLTRKT